MRTAPRLLTCAALVVTTTSCGNAVRTGRSPVYLVVNSIQAAPGNKPAQLGGTLLSDVITNVITPAPCSAATPCPTIFNDVAQAVLAIAPKDPGTLANPTTPSSMNAVTINRIHIEYVRADGRNTPGVDVPFGFDGAVTGTVQPGGTLTLGFEIVRHVAKEESPLVQLQSSATIITTLARITFYGRDQAGNEVNATGTIQVDFGNFGD